MADRKKLLEQLDALKIFPNNKLVKELRQQIKKKLEKKQPRQQTIPNQSRSIKLKKYHRYIKLVRNSFPELSHAEIRKQFSKRRRNKQVSIPDVIWQNPSP